MDCSISIAEYLQYREAIKEKLNIIKNECPKDVMNYLLKKESVSRMNKLIDCEYSDRSDKKLFLEFSKLNSCEQLKTIFN